MATATATTTKIRLTTRERREADLFWDALSDTGHTDPRGGAEYTGAFKSERRIRDYARAARGLAASVAKHTTAATN
jgi:hypothetical protein